jgi:DNA polymerase-3 subunit alpha
MALSGGRAGDIGRHLKLDRGDAAATALDRWLEVFDDRFFLELVRTGRSDEETCVRRSLELASVRSVPVVATNDVRFVEAGDFFAHEARVCIHQGRTLSDASRPREYSDQQYLKSASEMASLFADVPEALANSVEIARRLSFDLELGATFLPAFPVPAGQTTEEHLRAEANQGLDEFLERRSADSAVSTAAQHRARCHM